MDIEFIQYLMPDGRPQIVRIDRPDVIARKAAEIMKLGNRFECEMLSDYATVSLTITDDQGDVDIEVVPNGPEVPMAVDRLVERFRLPSDDGPGEVTDPWQTSGPNGA